MNMPTPLNDATVRLGVFLGVFTLVAIWEALAPRRILTVSKVRRWTTNLSLTALNTVVLRIFFVGGAIGLAELAHERGWGLLNEIGVSALPAIIVTIVVLDFVVYLQHVLFHALPILWRLHKVHHTDMDIDLTTGTRFHPVEIILSMIIKASAVLLLGAAPLGVLIFEVVLNATAMFNHGNLRLPVSVDRVLRWIVVTPDMHRVHHSVIRKETNSNYGFNLPWWDRLFGTYRAQPAAGHEGMTIGLNEYRDSSRLALPRLLVMPFARKGRQ